MDDGILPTELRAAANAAREETVRILAAWPEDIRPRFSKHVIYFDLPYLFLPAFSRLRAVDVAPLGVFCQLLASSLFVQDTLVDGDAKPEEVGVGAMGVMALQFEAYRVVQALLPADARFWERLGGLLRAHVKAWLDEQAFRTGKKAWSTYTADVARGIVRDKHGVSQSVLAALAELGNEEDKLEPLCQSLDHYNIAIQILDDIIDWKQDLADGTPSLLMRRVYPERPQAGPDEVRRMSREIYYGGHVIALLEDALALVDAAEQIRELAPGLPFYTATAFVRRKCRTLARDVERIVDTNLGRARARAGRSSEIDLPFGETRVEARALGALRFVIKQWQIGFGEAREITKHPQGLGIGDGEQCVYGDVFQRALIVDALCDVRSELDSVVTPILASECEYLLSRRSTTGIGGWRYYPEIDEIPPDADDLGQMIQVFLRAGRRDVIEQFGEGPLGVLLTDGLRPDGSFPTWIVRKNEQDESDIKLARLVDRLWGGEPDDAVVPNLLYALHLYDPERFREVIERGMDYLEKRQGSDGTFATSYYHGPFYGLYVNMRLFAVRRPGSPLVVRTLAALRGFQSEGGGFSFSAEGPNALHTAFALQTFELAPASAREPADEARVARAIGYLLEVRGEDGSFPNEKFIYPLVGVYGSRTMTTVFVLKALWAARRASHGAPANPV